MVQHNTNHSEFSQQSQSEHAVNNEFYIAGVGASAEGLDGLIALFENMPDDAGIAFVVVQHISEDVKHNLFDILPAKTSLAVQQAVDGELLQPNTIYLIPPNTEATLSKRRLLLSKRKPEHAVNLPIDWFFCSLAKELKRQAIGIMLSGTGSDGASGISDIKNAGGLTLCQDDQSARVDGTACDSAITALAHIILAPQQMYAPLECYVKESLTPAALCKKSLMGNLRDTAEIFVLLRNFSGVDFNQYKPSTIGRRLQRRMEFKHLNNISDYCVLLKNDKQELNALFKDLLIGVTRFFRDGEAFDVIQKKVLPQLIDRAVRTAQPLRVWVPSCASGEEAYSIAMLIDEHISLQDINLEWKIFATDIHDESLRFAARGVYTAEALNEISAERKTRYFQQCKDGYAIDKRLRDRILFAPQNLIGDAPFIQIDLISCRNFLIYLQHAAQKKVLSLFHFSLNCDGVLFVGPSETPGELSDEFSIEDNRWRIYSKIRDIRLPVDTRLSYSGVKSVMPRAISTVSKSSVRNDAQLLRVYDRLLEAHMPASVLIDEHLNVIHTFCGAERYLQMRSGRTSVNLLDMVDEDLKNPLASAVQHALKENRLISYSGIRIATVPDEILNINVQPLIDATNNTAHVAIEFIASHSPEAPRAPGETVNPDKLARERIKLLEAELRVTRENLQTSIEELETSNEELQAANEEMLTSNEELQSSNEELQSVNEELFTINTEHQKKIEELSQANNDMDNLLASTRVGVVFLDDELCIRRFTPEIGRIFHLMPQDIGRHIGTFVNHLRYENLLNDAKKCLTDDKEIEREVGDFAGIPHLFRMAPYRSLSGNRGVVMTVIDVKILRKTQQDLTLFRHISEQTTDCHILFNLNGKVTYINQAFQTVAGYHDSDIIGQHISVLGGGFADETDTILAVQGINLSNTLFESDMLTKDQRLVPIEVNLSVIDTQGEMLIFGTIRDISQRKNIERELTLYKRAIDIARKGIIITENDDDYSVIYANKGFEALTGYSNAEILGRNCRFLQGPATDKNQLVKIKNALKKPENIRLTLINYRKDGSPFWNDISITPVCDEKGVCTHFIGFQNDLTEFKKNEEALRKAQTEAENASKVKSEFVANMSHEIRTPLAAVMGYVDVMFSTASDDTQLSYLNVIKRNVYYLLDIINDILDLSKIESQTKEVRLSAINLPEFIEDVYSLISVRVQEKGLQFEFDYLSDIPKFIYSDVTHLRQILINLIANAIKFTDQGKVTLSVEYADNTLSFGVTDTGIGMSKETIDNLFQPFTRARDLPPRFGGTGLGLSISNKLAKRLNADINVESSLNKGSNFTLVIPISQTNDIQLINYKGATKKLEISANKCKEYDFSGVEILLTDDQPDIRGFIALLLKPTNARITMAKDGLEALEKAAVQQFDIMLMDMQMPFKSGFEVASTLRGLNYPAKIIALTAGVMKGERERCIQAGCDDFLSKPVDALTLFETIDSQLQKKKKSVSMRILIIEDHKDSATILSEILRMHGHITDIAADGKTAIELVSSFSPQICFVDQNLPDTTGTALIENLKSANNTEAVYVSLTGITDTNDVANILAAGFDKHFAKPLEMDKLIQFISSSQS